GIRDLIVTGVQTCALPILLSPLALETSTQRQQLDALIERVRWHPALYSYFITDEPNATNFPGLGKLVAYLREKDPAHLAYINLRSEERRVGKGGRPRCEVA